MIQTQTGGHGDWYRKWGKRMLDALVSCFALLLLWPVIALIAVVVRSAIGSPVLFRQRRPGQHGRAFTMLKFRTMCDLSDDHGEPLPDEQRVTKLGRLLRATSLDELPELFNVLRGDMSLVGPRPLLVEYMQYYTPEQQRRHEARPGMTGLAQINERNSTTWERRFATDLWYIDHYSFRTDLGIMARTPFAMLRGDGGTQATGRLGKYRGSASPGHLT
jgi:lipopolysaccharide/colanic/teichoic acid biosynthesis glycosyltransferase